MTQTFEKGAKVVPINKSQSDGTKGLATSIYWRSAKENNQPFLYVANVINAGCTNMFYLCNVHFGMGYGENFNPEDLIPYVETPQPPAYKIGDKVVPITKTRKYRRIDGATEKCNWSEGATEKCNNELQHSIQWKHAQESKQPFLYVTAIRNEVWSDMHYSCAFQQNVVGDFFAPEDLTPYVELPKMGDEVYVSTRPIDLSDPRLVFTTRIYVCSPTPKVHICVEPGWENKFKAGAYFHTMSWQYVLPIPPKPTSIAVQLNERVTATVTKDTVTISGECFPLNALGKLSKAVDELNREPTC
jgi:hypothetical protein